MNRCSECSESGTLVLTITTPLAAWNASAFKSPVPSALQHIPTLRLQLSDILKTNQMRGNRTRPLLIFYVHSFCVSRNTTGADADRVTYCRVTRTAGHGTSWWRRPAIKRAAKSVSTTCGSSTLKFTFAAAESRVKTSCLEATQTVLPFVVGKRTLAAQANRSNQEDTTVFFPLQTTTSASLAGIAAVLAISAATTVVHGSVEDESPGEHGSKENTEWGQIPNQAKPGAERFGEEEHSPEIEHLDEDGIECEMDG